MKKFLNRNSIKEGQSLFEVIVAIGISALILVGIVSLASGSVRNSSFSRNNAQATKYAQEGVEWLRGQRDAGWDNLATHSSVAGTTTCLGASPPAWGGSCTVSTDTKFTRNVVLTTDAGNSNIINALVTVSWSDSQGNHSVHSNNKFTNWRK